MERVNWLDLGIKLAGFVLALLVKYLKDRDIRLIAFGLLGKGDKALTSPKVEQVDRAIDRLTHQLKPPGSHAVSTAVEE